MLYAAFKGHAMVVKALLSAPGESTKVYEQENPLTIACAHRQEEVVEVLIRHGFSPNTCDGDGRAPLCVAALSGNEALVNLLLRHGADPTSSAWTSPPTISTESRLLPLSLRSRTSGAVYLLSRTTESSLNPSALKSGEYDTLPFSCSWPITPLF